MKSKFHPDKNGYFGQFGGAFIPELLYPNVKELQDNYIQIIESDEFQKEYKSLLKDYVKERGDSNLMEHMDKYRKRAVLMESATQKLFAMFNDGKTNDDVIHHYSLQRIEMPDSFVSKLRKNWEDLRKTKLDLKLADKEAEGFNQTASQTAPGGEVGMEAPMEEKRLASGLTN